MSNPAKALKKAVKAVVVVAAVVGIAYLALPALTGGAAAGASTAAASTGSFTAGSTALAAGGGGVAATTAATGAATAGTGLLGAIGSGAAKVGAAVTGASPMVKLGLIQAGSQALAAGMAPEEQTEAERLQDQLNVYHSQPFEARSYTTVPSGAGSSYTPNAGLATAPTSQYTPNAGTEAASTPSGLLGRYNPNTRQWEQAS